MHAKQQKILCIIGGTLAIGGIVFHILRRRSKSHHNDPEPVEFSPKELKEVPLPSTPVQDIVSADAPVNVETEQPTDGKHVFENIGASILLPSHWKIAEDISPIPNVAMVSISNTNYSPKDGPGQMPGSSPVLVLSVEDNSLEGLDLEEFKEKSKQTAMQQMYMMTNGMVPPRILFDGPQSNGDFEMVLEYALETTMFQIRVINFITMHDDLAYVFQFMGNAEVFAAEIDSVREIVRDFRIVPIPSTGSASQARVSDAELGYSVDLPVNWIIESRKSESIGDFSRVLSCTTASPVKTERVELIKSSTGAFDEAALRSIASLDKATGITVLTAGKKGAKKYSLFLENGISVMEYKNVSAHHVLVLTTREFAVRITPLRAQKTIIKPEILYGVLRSLQSDAAETSAVYINNRNGFSFPIKESSRVVESRVGDNTVTFAPEGIRAELLESINSMKPNEQSFEPMPIFTVRCGDPSTDKDCEKTLEGWMARLRTEQSRGDVKMIDLRYDELNGSRCISFSQKEMQETAPGKKDEHQAKITVLVEGGVTFMLRWETATEAWRKFEPSLNRLLDGFSIL